MSGNPKNGPRDQGLCTPPELFHGLCSYLRIYPTLDVAASDENHMCERWFTEERNGLVQQWREDWFCNPPFNNIEAWVVHAHDGAFRDPFGLLIRGFMLLPSRTDTMWFAEALASRDTENPISILFIVADEPRKSGRVRFLKNGVPLRSPFEGSLVLVFGQGEQWIESVPLRQLLEMGR